VKAAHVTCISQAKRHLAQIRSPVVDRANRLGFDKKRYAYYRALRQTQQTIGSEKPDWAPWLLFFLDALQRQKIQLEKRLERERILLGSLPELSLQLLEACQERGRINVAEAVRWTGANRSTIKDHLTRLTKTGYLARHGAGRGTWYALP
jgi:Fic family protein